MRRITTTAAAVLLGIAAAPAPAQEVIPHAQDRPPGPALSPAEAIAKMTVPDGFTVELVAAEPALVNPVAMTFDEKGRIWVTESLEYPRREPGPGRDRVKVLEDTDGDGAADRSTIFAEGLNIPSGIAVGHGGVWVANSPDILFYPDADRDAVPDGPPQVVVTGFGRDDTHELPNSLTWGPDGWLYGWNGVFNPSRVVDPKWGHEYRFTCAIFRIHPRTRQFQLFCEGTSNPWGLAINERGDFFASACVIDHLWHLTETGYYIRQGGPYPPLTWPQGSIVDHEHQKAAYCGIHYFDSPAYPEEYRGKLFMGNIHGNCINVDGLERNGSTYRAKARPDFLTANDAWFMPVVQKTGPDGCLYILDWYDRYHCYQDANRDPAGIDRLKGRLYRVRYQDTPRRTGFDLAALPDEELIKKLDDPNVYDRDIAQRLLAERLWDRKAAAEDLRKAVTATAFDRDRSPRSRRHALWALIGGSERLDGPTILKLLDDPDDAIRAWGVRAAGEAQFGYAGLAERFAELRHDPSPDVRLQLAIALPKVAIEDPVAGLVEVLAASDGDPLIPHIVWQNLKRESGPTEVARLVELAREAKADHSPALAAIWPRVVELAASNTDVTGPTVAQLVAFGLAIREGDDVQRPILAALTRHVRQGRFTGRRLELLRKHLADAVTAGLADGRAPLHDSFVELAAAWREPAAIEALRRRFLDPEVPAEARLAALDLLAPNREAEPAVLDAVASILNAPGRHPAGLRRRMLERLGPLESPRVAEIVLAAFPDLEPEARPNAIVILTERPAWTRRLLDAVESETIPASAVSVNQLRKMLAGRDRQIAERVRAIWGTIREGRDERRELVVGQMRNFLRKTPGDPVAGQAVFRKLCAQCHTIYGEGQDVGPDITSIGRTDFDQLISNVFDPNLVIGASYQATTVATTDGRVLTGLLAEDSPERIVLRLQGGQQEVIPRDEVEEKKTADISLMPEDVEKQLTPQEVADLFAFLALDRPPGDPSARLLPGAPEPKAASGR
jgi:putative heme-binding domain-containing protein